MMKIEIRINDPHGTKELAIDKTFAKYGLPRLKTNDGALVYTGAGTNTDWADLGGTALALMREGWFADHVTSIIWHNGDRVEDWLEIYHEENLGAL